MKQNKMKQQQVNNFNVQNYECHTKRKRHQRTNKGTNTNMNDNKHPLVAIGAPAAVSNRVVADVVGDAADH
jgi:hypothetical protein